MNLQNVEVTGTVVASGALTSQNCTYNNNVTLGESATLIGNIFAGYLKVFGSTQVTASGNKFTGQETLRLADYVGDTAVALAYVTSSSAADAYVGVYGKWGDGVMAATPASLSGGYKQVGDMSVTAGCTLTMAEGAHLGITDDDFYINGTLKAANNQVKDLITAIDTAADIIVGKNAVLDVTNANINLSKSSCNVDVETGGALKMNGGMLYTYDGTAAATGSTVNLQNVEVTGTVVSNGSLTATNCTFNTRVDCNGTTVLTDNTFASCLRIVDISQVTASGNKFTGQETVRLVDFSGSTAVAIALVTQATDENASIGFWGNLGDCTFVKTPDMLSGGYMAVDEVTVTTNATVELEAGATWNLNGNNLYVQGSLRAENEEETIVLYHEGSGDRIYVRDGGEIELVNSSIIVVDTSNYIRGTLQVDAGGSFSQSGAKMTLDTLNVYGTCEISHARNHVYDRNVYNGGRFVANDSEIRFGTYIYSGGSVEISDSTMVRYEELDDSVIEVENNGTLILKNTDMRGGEIYLYSKSVSEITGVTGCSYLYIDGRVSSADISANNFENTVIELDNLSSSGTINLSGNYWGTTDMDEITSRIIGYDANRVIINNVLLVDPTVSFTLLKTSLNEKGLEGQDFTSIDLFMGHPVDADSVTANSIKLYNGAGNELKIDSFSVDGKVITVNFGGHLEEGNYKLVVGEGIRNIAGEDIVLPESKIELNWEVDLVPPRILEVSPTGVMEKAVSYIDIQFSEAVDMDTLKTDVFVYDKDEDLTIVSIEELGDNRYRFHFAEAVDSGAYTIYVGPGVKDIHGNGLEQNNNGIFGEGADFYEGTFKFKDIVLSVTSAEVIGEAVSGGNLLVSWKGCNETGKAVASAWTDRVYLSRDAVWDIDDVLLGEVAHADGLAPGASYEGELSLTLPGLEVGNYHILVRSDLEGRELEEGAAADWVQNLKAVPIEVDVPLLKVGTSVRDQVSSADKQDCFRISSADALVKVLNMANVTKGQQLDVYISYGDAATAENYDVYKRVSSRGSAIRLVPDASGRDIYVMVRSRSGEKVDYTLALQEVPMDITDVTAQSLSVVSAGVFDIYGTNLKQGTEVSFIDSKGNVYPPDSVEYLSNERIRVNFVTGRLPSGRLDVRVNNGNQSFTSEDAVTLSSQGGAHIVFTIEGADKQGYHVVSQYTIKYENVGYEAMEAPLVTFTISQKGEYRAFLTFDESIVTKGFWTSTEPEGFTHSVSFLATSGNSGQLLPTGGEYVKLDYYYDKVISSVSLAEAFDSGVTQVELLPQDEVRGLDESKTVYYTGWQQPWDFSYPPFQLELSYVTAEDTTPLNWSDIVPSIGGSAETAALVKAYLIEHAGTTWGDYIKMLNAKMKHLDSLGIGTQEVDTYDVVESMVSQAQGKVSPLSALASTVDIATQTTGLSLAVSRTYANDIVSHEKSSVFGHGWTHNWDISLQVSESGDIGVNVAGVTILFQPDFTGGYVCTAGDGYSLKKNRNGSYKLTIGKGSGDLVYDFSESGELAKISDANGNNITSTYDLNGRLIRLTHSNGEWISYEYNQDGYVSKLTASNGTIMQYAYENGNLVSCTDLLGDTVGYSYSSSMAHYLTGILGKTGIDQVFTYGDDGLLTNSEYQLASSLEKRGQLTLQYDVNGAVTVTDQYGASSTYYYDLSGRVVKALDMNGNALYYTYNTDGQLVSQKDQAGHVTTYTYDDYGNVSSVTNALGQTIRYVYTKSGLLSSITDANGNEIRYSYDDKGQATSITYADGSRETWTYDAVGNVASWTSRAGKTLQMSYDAKGNLLSKTVEDEGTTNFTYDNMGHMLSSTDSGGTTTWTYDERYRMTKVQYPDGHSLSYTYDANDRIASMADDAGHITNYSYNAWGDLTLVTDGDGETVAAYEYDKGGRLVHEMKGNGTSTAYSYTLSGNTESITHYDADGEETSFFRYEYNEVGLRTAMTTEEGKWTYGYDAIGQLVQADFVPVAGSDMPEQHITYEYDAAGNRTRTEANGVETLYTNNELNQTTAAGDTQYEYDAAGNLIRKVDETGVTSYEWSVEGRLLSMITATGDVYNYTYNAAGERVSTSVNGAVTTYVYDGSGNVVTEYGAEGNSKYYQYGNGLIGVDDALNGKYWYGGDSQGSVTGITDASGNLIATYSYDPFGSTLSSTGSLDNVQTWLGLLGLVSDDSGLTYVRARYYDAQMGKFISSDPAGISGGLNLYAYCLNQPVSLSDSTGFAPVSEIARKIITGSTACASNTPYKTRLAYEMLDSGVGYIVDGSMSALHGEHTSPDYVSDWNQMRGLAGISNDAASLGAYVQRIRAKNYVGATRIMKEANKAIAVAGNVSTALAVSDLIHDSIILARTGDYRDMSGLAQLSGTVVDWAVTNLMDWVSKDEREAREKAFQEALRKIADENKMCLKGQNLGSFDPNDLLGPEGYGEENFVTDGREMSYTLRFENKAEAPAPARWVRLYTTFDEDYDLETFTLDSIYLAGNLITLEEGQDSLNKKVEMTFNGQTLMVDIAVNLDYETRELSASFMAVDPESGFMLQDLTTGILYPNDENGRGEGYITYTIESKAGLSTGTKLNNVADIYFDFNDVIPTPELNYTIDSTGPTSRMVSAVETKRDGKLTLTWSGDDGAGAGVAYYAVYVSQNGGEYTLWQMFDGSTTTADFTGERNTRYDFYVRAMDNVGFVEAEKNAAEISSDMPVLNGKDPMNNSVAGADALSLNVPVTNWVGKADALDNYSIKATGAGSYAVSINAADIDSGLLLSVGTMNAAGDFVVEESLLINPHSAVHALGGVNMQAGEQYYICVQAQDATAETEYELCVVGDVVEIGQITANNRVEKATKLKETTSGSSSPLAGWVGAGDALDFYRLEMAQAGRLSINLSGLEQNAKLRVYQERADGELTQKLSTTAKASSGLDRTLSLTAGTYFIEVAAYDKGAGLYNSTYALELEKEDKSGTKHYTLANG